MLSLTETYNPKSQLLGAAAKMVQNVNINICLIAIITALWMCFVETRFIHTESRVTVSYNFAFLKKKGRIKSDENIINCYPKAFLAGGY